MCIGLTEVISAASKDMVSVMSAQLGPTIRAALSDSNENVRDSAAATFEVLHNKLGVQAVEEIIPHLLGMLDASDDEKKRALDGLRRILASKVRIWFDLMIRIKQVFNYAKSHGFTLIIIE